MSQQRFRNCGLPSPLVLSGDLIFISLLRQEKLEGDWETILDEQKIMSLREWEGTQVSAANTISSRKQRAKAFNLENQENRSEHIVQLPWDPAGSAAPGIRRPKISSQRLGGRYLVCSRLLDGLVPGLG